MTNNTDDALLNEDYTLKRLVYINSANHAYSEIMLDSHLAMFGDNNSGKTASLAGTKLLLFTETDFYNCKQKFRFKGKTGLFSMEESYEFYFPDTRSFIVLEVVNPEGTFCMILYKKTNYGYGRIFVPVQYEGLRGIFWDREGDQFAEGLGINAVIQYMKEHDGIQLNDEREITDLMFASHRQSKARRRFCVLPFKDARKESIDVFRNIYHLAFETGDAETDSLPTAISTLLEMSRSRDQERLDANLIQLAEEHAQLLEKNKWLQSLANAKPKFDLVNQSHDAIKQKYDLYCQSFSSITAAFVLAKQDYASNYEQLNQAYRQAHSKAEDKAGELKDLSDGLIQKRTTVKRLGKDKLHRGKKLEKDQQLRAKYGDTPSHEILAWLQKDLDELKESLRKHREEGGTQSLLAQNIKKRKSLNENVTGLRRLISDAKSAIFYQLDDTQASSVLYSINSAFADIEVELDSHTRDRLLSFTRLFGQDGSGQLTFLHKTITEIPFKAFDPEAQLLQWKESLKRKQLELENLDSDIQEQKKAITNDDIDTLIELTKKEIGKQEDYIASIGGLDQLAKDVSSLQQEHVSESQQLEKDEKTFDVEQRVLAKLKGEANTLYQQLESLKGKENNFLAIENYLGSAKSSMEPLIIDVKPLSDGELTTKSAIELFEQASNLARDFANFRAEMNSLMVELTHHNVDPHKVYTDVAEYDKIVEVYQHEFASLEYDQIQQRHAIRSHNELVNNQLNELKEAQTLLANFINGINQELNSKHISNLKEIKLHHELNPSFLNLLDTLEQHDIQDDSLMETGFYESLASFVEKYFNKETRRLKMSDLISSMSYHYRLDEDGEMETKSQSGGTTCTITAFVIAVLMKRITPTYVQMHMPIILDEISVLDGKNTDSTIKQIAEHGFSLFCATPTFSSLVSHKVGKWIMIDQANIKQPLVRKCHKHILPEHVESYGEHEVEA